MHPLIQKYAKGGPVEVQEMEAPAQEADPALVSAASEVLAAIKSDSAEELAEALKSLFMIVDSQPHAEGEHV